MADTSKMSPFSTEALGLDPRFGSLYFNPATKSVGGSVNWVVVLVVVVLLLVFCSCCISFLYVFRFQIYDLVRPRTVTVEGYRYKDREIPDEYSGY